MKRLITLFTTLGLLAGMFAFAVPASATVDATEVCVSLYENINGGGDTIQWCDFVPSGAGLHDTDLSNNTSGLSGGCTDAAWPYPGSWNDCVSSAREYRLPGAYRARWSSNANCSLGLSCVDTNGTTLINTDGFYNDTISSWRLETGNCP